MNEHYKSNNKRGVSETENSKNSHELISGHQIAIATTTFYKDWYPGEPTDQNPDKIRGNLALRMLTAVLQKDFQIIVVDGGSSQAFRETLKLIGIPFRDEDQNDKGMSGSRRTALKEASKIKGTKVICWVEPEKVSIVEDCLPGASSLILEDKADIVIPKRDKIAFATYPNYQAQLEQKANKKWNELVRGLGLYNGEEDLDIWIGPRFIKNDPKIVEYFQEKNDYNQIPSLKNASKVYNLDLWASSISSPIVHALYDGYRVVSVPVPYRHPPEQTANETDSLEFKKKRELQYHNIIIATIHMLRKLREDPKSRLK